ncbi:MAG: peptidoglycan DD-metalloendopeptidase family protein [Caulobacter sp.]|nr:peptidoglycan DD-metalloendopeptidase family protein [Caulobacter sp.]
MTHLYFRTALVALIAGMAAGCASTPAYPTVEGAAPGTGPQLARPAYPVQAPDEEPAPAPQARPSTPVASGVLPPVRSAGPVETAPLPPPPMRAPQYAPPPPPPPEPITKVVILAPGKVVDVDGRPRTFTVKSGQGLDAVAREMGSSRAELAKINDLAEPYRLKPGQVLKGPASRAKAYVVASGDNLYAIARRFNVTVAALADENSMEIEAPIHPNQQLRLPAGYKDDGPTRKTITVMPEAQPPAPVPAPTPVRAPEPAPQPAPRAEQAAPVRAQPVPAKPVPAPPKPTPTPVPTPISPKPLPPAPELVPDDRAPVLSDDQIAALGRGKFQWPVEGQMLSSYGPKGGGQRNDGLNIAATAGTPVRAASAGKVVYSGGDVPGFGVTVLIQHDDGWVTVYGHLARADVRMQQQVTEGQQIGQVGSSGGVSQPQLHFEIRYSPSPKFKAKAIDPALVLPRR